MTFYAHKCRRGIVKWIGYQSFLLVEYWSFVSSGVLLQLLTTERKLKLPSSITFKVTIHYDRGKIFFSSLSGQFSARQAWRHVLSLKRFKRFCWNPVLSWEIKYSVFQPIKFVSSFQKLCLTIHFQFFDIWWSSLDIINDFKAISRMVFFRFGEINKSWFWVLSKKFFFHFF